MLDPTVSADSGGVPAEPGQAGQADLGRRLPSGLLPGWLVATIAAVAELAVGGYRIAGPSLWRDEAATISGSQRPLGDIAIMARQQDAVHAPYYLLMHLVIAAGGTSPAVLRLPSLVAMCVAAALTALLGRRLAAASGLCWLSRPDLAGLAAGLALVAVPLTTRYAQEARPYALTSACAVLATCLLVRAAARGAWPWWAAYALALTLTGLFNLFAVLLAVAHGLSLLAAASRPGDQAPRGAAVAVTRDTLRRWLVACAVAAVLLVPLAAASARQSAQLNWVTTPDPSTVAALLRDFAGVTLLVPVIALLAGLGCAAGAGLRRGRGLTLAVVALPWLVVPPVLLIAASLIHPVYVERYVVFCLPALALLSAAGLAWLGSLARRAAAGRGLDQRRAAVVAGAACVLVAGLVVAALAGPQAAIRQATSRPDDLRAVAATVAGHEQPGDAIVYLPWNADLVAMAYPGPFTRLRDVGLGRSPIVSDTLRGVPASPAVVASRLAGVTRLWTVQWASPLPGDGVPASLGPVTRAIGAMRLLRRWRISSVILSLYARRHLAGVAGAQRTGYGGSGLALLRRSCRYGTDARDGDGREHVRPRRGLLVDRTPGGPQSGPGVVEQ